MTIKSFLGGLVIAIIGALISVYANEIKTYFNSSSPVKNVQSTQKIVTPVKDKISGAQPAWCTKNGITIKELKDDEVFICIHEEIWKFENKYVYNYEKIYNKSNKSVKKSLNRFAQEWLSNRKKLCTSSVELCVEAHKNILTKLLKNY